jgi:uncharacterized protein (DUF952 family)
MLLMADETIYHITERENWEAARAAGEYVAESLGTQGYIHASTREQVVETANLFYAGQDGLVLLCIETSKLTAPLKREAASNAGHRGDAGLFPHLYGALNLDAVTRVLDFPCRVDGSFELPAALGGGPARRDPITQATHMTEDTAQKLLGFLENTEPVRRLRASQLATGILGAVGFALFVVGVEQAAQDIPVIENAYGSIGVGIVLLLATGLLLRKLSGGGE